MIRNKLVSATTLAVAGALALSACGSSKKNDSINNTTSLTVGWNQPFYSLNQWTTTGNNNTNANVSYLTSGNFNYYDKDLHLQKDTSFGTYSKVSDAPMTIKEDLSDKAKWSDGQPVVNADSVLSWAAQSGQFNTATADKMTNKDGSAKTSSGNTVFFNSGNPAYAKIKLPTAQDGKPIDANGKGLEYQFTDTFSFWESNLVNPGLPAHIVAKLALGIDDPAKANQALVDAFAKDDKPTLAKIANVWNTGFDFTSMPSNKDLLVSDGPYKITDAADKQFVQLGTNDQYDGDHKPSIKQLIINFNEDGGAQLQDLQNGKVGIIQPQATQDLLKNAQGSSNATVIQDNQASWEHVDLTLNNGGPFDPKTYGGDVSKAVAVRKAFLMLIPRQEIVDKLIKPLAPTADVRNSFDISPDQDQYADTTKANGMADAYPATVDAATKAKAQALLKQAGVTTPPQVRYLYAKSNPRRQNEFQMIQASMKGIFNIVDDGNDKWSSMLGTGVYDAAMFAWSSTAPTLQNSEANYVKGGSNNFTGYYDPKMEALWKQIDTTTDEAKQFQLNQQVEKLLVDSGFGTTIFQFPNVTVYNKNMVTGVSDNPIAPTYFWNFWEWKLPNS